MKKRTNIDFSNHQLRIEGTEKEPRYVLFKLNEDNEESYTHRLAIQIVNDGKSTRTLVYGDFGNWVFSRLFEPSSKGAVSDYYWIEKLDPNTEAEVFDYEETRKELLKALLELVSEDKRKEVTESLEFGDSLSAEDFAEFDSSVQPLDEYFELYASCTDEQIEYDIKVRDCRHLNFEDIPYVKKPKLWLEVVFDGFEAMCKLVTQKLIKE